MKSTCLFFLNSPKRNKLLLEIVNNGVIEATKRKPLLELCKTRWAARHVAYQHFYQCYSFLVKAFEVIAFDLHSETLSNDFANAKWDADSKSNANSLLNGITDFEFIVVFLLVYQFLSHLAGPTVKLQRSSIDIIEAHKEIESVKSLYKSVRNSISEEFHKIYQQAERMGAKVNVEPSKPRSCSHQMSRLNVAMESIEDWFKINVAIPFLDRIITELDAQFTNIAHTVSKLLYLVPSIMSDESRDVESDVLEIVELYYNDLPSPETFQQEFSRWKFKFQTSESKPSNCVDAIKQCDPISFPNVFILLQIACTIPITSCECERNASVLRDLHNYSRTSMSVDRLTALALMHIHYQHPVDLDEVVNLFAELYPRRVQLSSVLL